MSRDGVKRLPRLLVLLLGFASACHRVETTTVPADPPVAEPGIFADWTAASGIDFTYRNGEEGGVMSILESVGGGVALFDYDRDGRLDIFVTGGGQLGPGKKLSGLPNRLFRNEGQGRFRDVTLEVGLPLEDLFYSTGCAVADFDNDGWPDLLVTGYGRLALYHNRKGKFEEISKRAGLHDERPVHFSTSAAWADLDGNGFPDLVVGHYVDWSFDNHPRCAGYQVGQANDICSPRVFHAVPLGLFFNNGDGTFRPGPKMPAGKTLGVLIADFDDDGHPDIYVANDTVEKFLLINDGKGKFTERGAEAGVALDDNGVANGSMGLDCADYDGSGRLSIFVANYENETHGLYRNLGRGYFQFASRPSGIARIGLSYVAFGTSFLDFDRDGAEDIVISNGHAVRYPASGKRRQKPVLLHNLCRPDGSVRFEEVTGRAGSYFAEPHLGRGLAVGDLDDDGRSDLVFNNINEPVRVLHNELDNGHHWLGLTLIGQPYRDAVGARATLTQGKRKLVRVVKGGGSYLSASDPRLLFGLGSNDSPYRLEVRWPSGRTQSWTSQALGIDRYVILEEGQESVKKPG